MAPKGLKTIFKTVFEKGTNERCKYRAGGQCGELPCGPFKEHSRMGGKDTLSALETLHWCPGHGGALLELIRYELNSSVTQLHVPVINGVNLLG